MSSSSSRNTRTSAGEGLDYLNRVLAPPSHHFLVERFPRPRLREALKRTGRRHDPHPIRISDPREQDCRRSASWSWRTPKTGERLLVDTASRQVREAFAQAARQRQESLRQLARQARIDLVDVSHRRRSSRRADSLFQAPERRLRRT